MDYRKVFNNKVCVEDFDEYRFRYCDELFADVISHARLDEGKSVLEIGPGTGQATEPILKTNCSYFAVELGESFTKSMQEKFCKYKNFSIVNADFETYPFEKIHLIWFIQQQQFNGYRKKSHFLRCMIF